MELSLFSFGFLISFFQKKGPIFRRLAEPPWKQKTSQGTLTPMCNITVQSITINQLPNAEHPYLSCFSQEGSISDFALEEPVIGVIGSTSDNVISFDFRGSLYLHLYQVEMFNPNESPITLSLGTLTIHFHGRNIVQNDGSHSDSLNKNHPAVSCGNDTVIIFEGHYLGNEEPSFICRGGYLAPSIGPDPNTFSSCKSIIFNSGLIDTSGRRYGAAIGPSSNGYIKEIIFNGGVVKAQLRVTTTEATYSESSSSIIGGGSQGSVGKIIINGGRIEVIPRSFYVYGALIGSGPNSNVSLLEVNGGIIVNEWENPDSAQAAVLGCGTGNNYFTEKLHIFGGSLNLTGGRNRPAIGTSSYNPISDLVFEDINNLHLYLKSPGSIPIKNGADDVFTTFQKKIRFECTKDNSTCWYPNRYTPSKSFSKRNKLSFSVHFWKFGLFPIFKKYT